VLIAGGGPLVAAATGLVLSTRTVAFPLARSGAARRRAVFRTSGLALFAVWNTALLVGAPAGQALGAQGARSAGRARGARALSVAAVRVPGHD